MKNVSLKDLKRDLSYWTEEASKGRDIQVTKYNRPYVIITSSGDESLHRGKLVGQANLTSILNEATKGKWLHYMDEDRQE